MLNLRDLTPHIGVEVSGVDLTRGISNAMAAELLRALDTRGVVILRGQQLTLAHFIAFSRNLGTLELNTQQQFSHADFPELTTVSNIIENGEPIGVPDSGRVWQSSGAHLKTPYRATVQYAVEVPMNDGVPLGDTSFASTSAAYEALEPALRQQIQGIQAVHIHGKNRKKRSTSFWLDSGLTQGFHGGVHHPVVRAHPITGQKCLYVNRASTSFIRGMHDQYSAGLLDQLYQHMARAEFIYRHQWQVGDVVLWDNCSTQHCSERDYELPQRRLIYSTLLKGMAAR